MPFSQQLSKAGAAVRCAGSGLIALDVILSRQTKQPLGVALGGSCGNVLAILAYFGWLATPIARLGHDSASHRLRSEFECLRAATTFLDFDHDVSAPVVVQYIDEAYKDGFPTHRFSQKCPKCKTWLPQFRSLVRERAREVAHDLTTDFFYFDRVSPAILLLAQSARESGSLVLFEPQSMKDEKMFEKAIKLSHVVKYSSEKFPNGLPAQFDHVLEIATAGSDGLKFRIGDNWTNVQSWKIAHVRDTSGAGDWCTAGFIHFIAQSSLSLAIPAVDLVRDKLPVFDALSKAQALSALNCSFVGARSMMQQLTFDELAAVFDQLTRSESFSADFNVDHGIRQQSRVEVEDCLCKLATKNAECLTV